jgi:hypothetical protein
LKKNQNSHASISDPRSGRGHSIRGAWKVSIEVSTQRARGRRLAEDPVVSCVREYTYTPLLFMHVNPDAQSQRLLLCESVSISPVFLDKFTKPTNFVGDDYMGTTCNLNLINYF